MIDQAQTKHERRFLFYFVFDAHIPLLTRSKVNDWVDLLLQEMRKMPECANAAQIEMMVFGVDAHVILPLTPLRDVKENIFRYSSVTFTRSYRSMASALRAVTADIQMHAHADEGGRAGDYAPIVLMLMGDSPDDLDKTPEPAEKLVNLRFGAQNVQLRAVITHADIRMPPIFKSVHSLYALSLLEDIRHFLRELIVLPETPLVDRPTAAGDAKPAAPQPPAAVGPWLTDAAPKPSSAPLIFISYQRGDWDEFVRPLVDRLRADGLNVWIDQHLIEGGTDWMDTINGALDACDQMILCVSPEALASRYVKYEYRYFFNNDKRIYPLICRSAKLPPEIATVQYFTYTYSDLEKLTALLKAR